MGNVCARCDRTDCPTLLQRPEPYQWEPRDSCYVSPAWKEWRDAVESAASDCRNHVVDWRAEALTLRAQVATLRAECDAARADLARVREALERVTALYEENTEPCDVERPEWLRASLAATEEA